jgi:hypothetical protein
VKQLNPNYDYIEAEIPFMSNTFRKLSVFIFSFILMTGCGLLPEGKHYSILLKPSSANPQVLESALAVVNKRLETVYKGDVVARMRDNLVELDLSEKVDVKELLYLVTATGRFTMHEVYTAQEIQPQIEATGPITMYEVYAAQEIPEQASATEPDGLGFLSMGTFGGTAGIIGQAGRYDTAAIMHSPTLQKLRQQNGNLQFMWGVETKEFEIPLYAVKKATRRNLNNRSIESSFADIDQMGKECVSIELKRNYYKAWETMTHENLSRPIAICVDNVVLSAPIVSGEISNGKLQISGQLDMGAKMLAALLDGEELPLTLTVVSIDDLLKSKVVRAYPTEMQVQRYNVMRKEYIQHRRGIDSLLLRSPMNLNVTAMRRELRRVCNEDLPTIVDEAGLTEAQVDQFLDKASSSLEGFKTLLDPNAKETQQSVLESLAVPE